MYLEKNEILHLVNKKNYKVINYLKSEKDYYYLLRNIDNNKYIVVSAYLIDSKLYLKEVKDEEILKKLNFEIS